MRDYGRVYSTFWTSEDTRSLSDDGRMLALYLLSGPHGTIAGVCRLPDGYVCEDLKWSSKRVKEGFTELFRKGFANRCGTTDWVWIRKFLAWNTPENPNQWKAARRVANSVPSKCSWKHDFARLFAQAAGDPIPANSNGSGTLSEPLPTQDQEQDLYQDQDQEQDTEPAAAVEVGCVFSHWRTTHNHPRAQLDAKRKKLIQDRLKQYSQADLCQSITGYLNSSHHMGQNSSGAKFDDLELLLRDAKHVDMGLKFYAEPPRTDLSEQSRRIIDQTKDWVPPEVRNAKH